MQEETKEEISEIKIDKKLTVSKAPKFPKEKEALMFKELVHKSYKDVGYDYGVNLFFPGNDSKITQYVQAIAKRIKKVPELWGISEDVVTLVQEALDSRSIRNNPKNRLAVALGEESFRDKLDTMRDQTAELLRKKLEVYGKNKKSLEGVSVRDLKDLLAMAIDKSRLLKGESTENLVKLSKLDVDSLTAEDAMKVIQKARENLLDNKTK